MKRWPLRILFCLILGAITTVAVAWTIVLFMNPGWITDPYNEADIDGGRGDEWVSDPRDVWVGEWMVMTWQRTGELLIASLRLKRPPETKPERFDFPPVEQLAIDTGLIEATDEFKQRPEITTEALTVECSGWPCLALFSIRGNLQRDVLGSVAKEFESGWDTGRQRPHSFGMPLLAPVRPIWPGFVIDTLFYGAIWFGVFFGFASAKRAIRRRRGRCPRCGYDLRGQLAAGCPECGWGRTL